VDGLQNKGVGLMASPYFSPINLPTQDFSAIRQAGESWGRAYQQAGQAIGQIGSAYFKRKGMEKQASQFIKSDMGKDYLRGMGWDEESINKIDNDPKEAEKLAYDAIREAGGVENVEARMYRSMQEDRQRKTERRQNYLFNQQKLAQQGEIDHYNTMSQEVMNPEYESIEKEISGLRTSMRDLAETTEDPSSKEYSGKINSYLGDIKKKQDELSDISKTMPMYELDPAKFNVAYGRTDNPYQMKHKMNTLQLLQKRKDTLGDNNFDMLKQKAEAKNLIDQENAEVGFNQFRDLDPYVFDESDRMRKVMDYGAKSGLQFTKDQRQDMASSIRLIDPEKVSSSKKSIFDRYKVADQDSIMESSQDLNTLLASDNPIADVSAVEKFARILQPEGLLTEDDINRAGGSKGLVDRLGRAYEELKTGKLSTEARNDLEEVAGLFMKIASERKYLNVEKSINEVAKKYDARPEDIRERFFSEDLRNIPADQLKRIKGEGGGEMMEVKHQGKMVEGEVIFEFKDGKKLVRLPNGDELVY
jgi:hypothetical protein